MDVNQIAWNNAPLSQLIQDGISDEGQAMLQSMEQLEANIDRIEEWLRGAFRAMAGRPVHLLSIQLGDAPELLAAEGHTLRDGQASADAVLEQVSQDEWEWMDDEDVVDFDAIEDLGYHKVNELPHPPYDFDDEDDDGGEEVGLPYEDREGIWALMVHVAMRRIIRDSNLSQVLTQGQTAVPVFVGFEDAPELVAVLTPSGFQQPFA
jgi:hypothetical protein